MDASSSWYTLHFNHFSLTSSLTGLNLRDRGKVFPKATVIGSCFMAARSRLICLRIIALSANCNTNNCSGSTCHASRGTNLRSVGCIRNLFRYWSELFHRYAHRCRRWVFKYHRKQIQNCGFVYIRFSLSTHALEPLIEIFCQLKYENWLKILFLVISRTFSVIFSAFSSKLKSSIDTVFCGRQISASVFDFFIKFK